MRKWSLALCKASLEYYIYIRRVQIKGLCQIYFPGILALGPDPDLKAPPLLHLSTSKVSLWPIITDQMSDRASEELFWRRRRKSLRRSPSWCTALGMPLCCLSEGPTMV